MSTSLQARIDALQQQMTQDTEKEKQLITIEESSALQIFTEQTKIESLLAEIKSKALTIVPDVYTEKGRKDIASMAYSVARTKTYLDSIGKDLVTQYKELPKKIDSGRKFARDALDLLRDEVRKPLDEWEEEQARLKLIEEIKDAHIVALEMNKEFDHLREQKRQEEEMRLKEIEAIIRIKAIKEAEERAQREKEFAIEALKLEQIVKQKEHEKKLIAAQRELELAEQHKQKAIEEEKRKAAEQQKIILDRIAQQEKAKAFAEEQKRIADEKRMADKNHKTRVKNEIIESLVLCAHITREQASCITDSIFLKQIPHLFAHY